MLASSCRSPGRAGARSAVRGPPSAAIVIEPRRAGDVALGRTSCPSELPVLPLRDAVPFPDTLMPLAVGQERSSQLVNDVLAGDRMLVMVATPGPRARDARARTSSTTSASPASVARMIQVPDGTLRILVHGAQRVRIDDRCATEPYLVARVAELRRRRRARAPELTRSTRNVQKTFSQHHRGGPLPARGAADGGRQPRRPVRALAPDRRRAAHQDRGAARRCSRSSTSRKRLRRLAEILARELELVAIGSQIQSQVQSEMDKGQREYFLRQQLKAIQEELGERRDPAEAEVAELREQLEGAELPEDVRRQADRELSRLESLPPAAAEHGVIRTYLEWLAELPWDTSTDDNLDLATRARCSTRDHYDIEQVKDRILEFLAVRKLKPDARGSILCFVGPPGVGKTSLGPLDRPRAGAQLRAHQRRRRARRGGDPRPPPHLHRRDAGDDHPRAARRGLQQPACS